MDLFLSEKIQNELETGNDFLDFSFLRLRLGPLDMHFGSRAAPRLTNCVFHIMGGVREMPVGLSTGPTVKGARKELCPGAAPCSGTRAGPP